MSSSSLKILDSGSDDRLVWVDVAILGEQLTVTANLAESLCSQYPSISQHTCKTGSFGEHLPGALLPHALEHLVIDLLVKAYPNETFAGNTRWIQRSAQTMRVRLSLPANGDASAVETAFSQALVLLNGLITAS